MAGGSPSVCKSCVNVPISPAAHTKLGFAMYRLGDPESMLARGEISTGR